MGGRPDRWNIGAGGSAQAAGTLLRSSVLGLGYPSGTPLFETPLKASVFNHLGNKNEG